MTKIQLPQRPLGELKRFGMMGGSFNPVHLGHVSIAQQVQRQLNLERVILMPAATPPHKQTHPELATAADRLEMCRLAIENLHGLGVSDLELKRGGISYTVETARLLREAYGPQAEIRFVIGSDSLIELHSWYRIDELLSLIDFAVADRREVQLLPQVWEIVSRQLGGDVAERLRNSVVPVERVDVSSTQIRECVRQGKSIKGLVRSSVATYIQRHRIYILNAE